MEEPKKLNLVAVLVSVIIMMMLCGGGIFGLLNIQARDGILVNIFAVIVSFALIICALLISGGLWKLRDRIF